MVLFWDLLIFYQSFHSPEVKGDVIISNKDGNYEFRPNLSKDLRLLRSKEIFNFKKTLKTAQDFSSVHRHPLKNKMFCSLFTKLLKTRY